MSTTVYSILSSDAGTNLNYTGYAPFTFVIVPSAANIGNNIIGNIVYTVSGMNVPEEGKNSFYTKTYTRSFTYAPLSAIDITDSRSCFAYTFYNCVTGATVSCIEANLLLLPSFQKQKYHFTLTTSNPYVTVNPKQTSGPSSHVYDSIHLVKNRAWSIFNNQLIVAEGISSLGNQVIFFNTVDNASGAYLAPIAPNPSITPSISISVTPTPSISISVTPTPTPSISVSVTPTMTVTPTPSISVSVTPTPTITPTVTPSISVSPSVGATPTPSPTPNPSATPSLTPTVTPTNTPSNTPPVSVTPSNTPSNTPLITPSLTPTVTPSITVSVTPTASVTPTVTPSNTPSNTPPVTPSVTPSHSPPVTPSNTVTPTPSISISLTPTVTPTITPSVTPTPSPVTLSITVSQSSLSGPNCNNADACDVTTTTPGDGTTTVSVSGGSGSYTYAWYTTSGTTYTTINSPDGPTTSFTLHIHCAGGGHTQTDTAYCNVYDSVYGILATSPGVTLTGRNSSTTCS